MELLLAIAILGIITGVLAATFHTAVTAWRTGTAAADTIHHADATMEQLYMALRSAFYPETKAPLYDYGFQHGDDGGEMPDARDTIGWVKIGNALVGEDAPYAGVPHRVEVSLLDDDAPQGAGLYVRSWRLSGQSEEFDPAVDVEPVLLSREIVGFNCQMMDPDKRPSTFTDPIEWMDEWTQTNRIPEAVRISLALKSGSPRNPPLVIERFVGIPMAELSWNPTVTGGSTSTSKAKAASNGNGDDNGNGSGGTP